MSGRNTSRTTAAEIVSGTNALYRKKIIWNEIILNENASYNFNNPISQRSLYIYSASRKSWNVIITNLEK